MANPLKVNAKVQSIVDHGSGIFTVRFSVPERYTRFKAGQFLHLALDEFDPTSGFWPDSRVFSIASEPRKDYVEIVYSVKGHYTGRMSRELVEGRNVWLKLPYGNFIIENHINEERLMLIAGGTGISPYIPFLKKYVNEGWNTPLHIYYGIRSESLFLYSDVIRQVSCIKSARISLWVEEGPLPDGIESRSGRFDISVISDEIAQGPAGSCFISGPPIMLSCFKTDLVKRGFPPGKIIIDEWE